MRPVIPVCIVDFFFFFKLSQDIKSADLCSNKGANTGYAGFLLMDQKTLLHISPLLQMHFPATEFKYAHKT